VSAEIDHDGDDHHGKMQHPDHSQPEGLFTELESAMDAASSHLLTAETIIDTSSTYNTSDVDPVVSASILLL